MPNPTVTLTLPNHSVVLSFFYRGGKAIICIYIYSSLVGPQWQAKEAIMHTSFLGSEWVSWGCCGCMEGLVTEMWMDRSHLTTRKSHFSMSDGWFKMQKSWERPGVPSWSWVKAWWGLTAVFFFSSIPSLFLCPVGTFLVQRKLLHKKHSFRIASCLCLTLPFFFPVTYMEARGAFQILAQIISLFKLFSIWLPNSEWSSMPHSAWLQAITRSSSVTM